MTEFTIDDNVPVPNARGGEGRRGEVSNAAEKLQVGQSFFVPRPQGIDAEKQGISVSGNVGRLRKALAAKGQERAFATRAVVEKGVAGVRVWRTK